MKRPKITIEELIAREGGWLGGVRPAELSVRTLHEAAEYFDFKWAKDAIEHPYPEPETPFDRFMRAAQSARLSFDFMDKPSPALEGIPVLRRDDPRVHLPPPGTRVYIDDPHRGETRCVPPSKTVLRIIDGPSPGVRAYRSPERP
jgi:hypothetical protein